MKTRAEKTDETGVLCAESSAVGKSPVGKSPAGEIAKNQDPSEGCRQDQQLVERCITGDVTAWEDLYTQCHAPLLALVKGMLHTADANLVDEIAARVWYALVANDGELLTRFNPSRGARLITFMRAIARDEAKRYFRTEVRRREREAIATRERSTSATPDGPSSYVLIEEFLTTLSPDDRTFCLQHALAPSSPDIGGPPTEDARWQHTRRLYKKMLAFLGREM